ncbi:hypothetical protein AB0I30_33860 [Nocardia tengchongensis]|uniref:hypothetical protein n=1 Tax=Nocardia tengchongensis TaxID=2055889 RepID=UPI0033FD194E
MTSARVIPFPAPAHATELRPPRLTFAGCCLWCGDRECVKPDCIGLHEISEWMVCSHCHGTGEGFKAEPKGCTCAFGLALVAPAIERRRELIPGKAAVIDEGHWSQYNHRTYGVTISAKVYAVTGDQA